MNTRFSFIMNARFFIMAFSILYSPVFLKSQTLFRSGIFLHHSTGQNIWGPNGSSTSVPQEMDNYNTLHGYTGMQAVTMNEEWWSPSDNEWVTQHAFFEDPSPVTGIGYYLPGNRIIVIKSCFPSSAMSGTGLPDDTLSPDMKTMVNYKWHWRHIVKVMKSHPENFFVIWTNAPLEPGSTNADEAALSEWFCTWAKDTLAAGLDPVLGLFPGNVYVFDFFHKLTGPNGMMLSQYAAGPGDSHPNAAATALVAPQFVQEIFNASIGYESAFGIIPSPGISQSPVSAFPNPFCDKTLISFTLAQNQPATLDLYDMTGKKVLSVWNGDKQGDYHILLTGKNLPSGVFNLHFSENKTGHSLLIIHK
jgi:hypothetical protein